MGNKKTNLEETIRKNALLLIFAAMCLVFAIFSPTFRTLTNWMNVLRQVSINGILAVGMTMIICSAGIDLSIGPLCAMSGVVSALILEKSPDFPVLLAMLIGILASGVMSMWTAFLVANMRIAPFIATLSTMSVAKGVGLVIADGMPHTIAHPLYTALGSGFVWDPKLTGNVSLPQPVLVSLMWVASKVRQACAFLRIKEDLKDPSDRLAFWIDDGDCYKWTVVVCNNIRPCSGAEPWKFFQWQCI